MHVVLRKPLSPAQRSVQRLRAVNRNSTAMLLIAQPSRYDQITLDTQLECNKRELHSLLPDKTVVSSVQHSQN